MSYNGDYLENMISEGNTKMIKSLERREKDVKRKLMSFNDMESYFEENIDAAILELKRINYGHWKGATKHSSQDVKSRLDHFLKTDDVLFDMEHDKWIAIDWTLNMKEAHKKLDFHKKLKSSYDILNIDATVVVYVKNEGVVTDKQLAKFIFKVLKHINKEVLKPDFIGALMIDAKQFI